MISVKRTNSENSDFINLVKYLDADLKIRDGEDHPFYAQFNKLDNINHVIVAFEEGIPVGCGAIKEYTRDAAEIKRMYTDPDQRRKGIASKILTELENWARELAYRKCILETGIKQQEAIALYLRRGYKTIENYGQYAGVANSLCFERN